MEKSVPHVADRQQMATPMTLPQKVAGLRRRVVVSRHRLGMPLPSHGGNSGKTEFLSSSCRV